MCNFKIGQEVVAIKTHSSKLFIKGQIFRVKGIKEPDCSCSTGLLNIGIVCGIYTRVCSRCRAETDENSGFVWFKNECFAPLQTDSEEADMKAALEEVFERELFSI